MLKIFSQYLLHKRDETAMDNLDSAFNDGFRTVGMMPGFGHDEDSWTDGMLILHKPDAAAPAPGPVKTSSADKGMASQTPEFPSLDDFYALVRSGNYVVLDAETTSRTYPNICQIAIIDSDGNELLNTLVHPAVEIPDLASRIHGITNDGVKDAPGWMEVQPQVRDILRDKNVIIYNATFDRKAMHESDRANGMAAVKYKAEATYWDAMQFYAEFNGERWNGDGDFVWKKLTDAAARFGIDTAHAHTALADCKMTLEVIKAMAQETVGE